MITNKNEFINKIGSSYLKELTPFTIGDTVKVHFKIIEGKRERIQLFEGIVIAMKSFGVGKTFTVRKISFNVGVE
ncbi:MAG: 50S ribosomal protein L19, partial [Spirochaetota bacterium]|nr:50S ribosomal protein L19 [Spirochaetota bacterium]